MSVVAEFLQSPSEVLLDSLTKEQLRKVAGNFEIELPSQARKDRILSTIRDGLVDLGVLPAVEGSEVGRAVSPQVSPPEQSLKFVRPVAGVGVSLTFEQHKELLTLQHKLELEREERIQALRAQVHAAEIEKLKCSASLREAELHGQREQQQLERFRLDLMKEGGIGDSASSHVGDYGAGGSPYFDVSTCLRLVPKFSEKDPDTFFLLFERLAKNRKWSDSQQTLLL